jgi:hypothetical protein
MKRTSLTTAVIAGIAGVAGISNMASAVYLNNDGLGQVLVYPYYTVNKGNSTIVTVVNTTAQGKAIKVRFLEAYDSREVLDFNLFMSPQDVWTAQVVPVGSGAGVFSNDNSCTVPTLPKTSSTAYPFSTNAFTGANTDGGPTSLARTLEGYVELIEMGTVTGASLTSITHVAGIPPCAKGIAGSDVTVPSGGLFGSGTIVNVAQGTVEAYNADAIDQFWAPAAVGHFSAAGSILPNLASGTSNTSYVFSPGPLGTTPTLATSTFAAPVDAVSSLFMADAIYNEYWTGGGTALSSEWVVTFPTKRFYVDPQLVLAAAKPFDVLFSSANGGTSCSQIGLSYTGREEEKATVSQGFSPPPPNAPANALCYEAQVVSFNQASAPSSVLGSNLVDNITTGYGNGWATIQFWDGTSGTANHVLGGGTTGTTNAFRGLPVTGFWVVQAVNGSAGGAGILSNYTALYRHKSHRFCSVNNAGAAQCS